MKKLRTQRTSLPSAVISAQHVLARRPALMSASSVIPGNSLSTTNKGMTWSFQMVSGSRSRSRFFSSDSNGALTRDAQSGQFAGSDITADRLLMDSQQFRGLLRAEIFRTAALRSRS
jgi:hypothetical protein